MFSALNNKLRILAEHKKLNHSRKLRQIKEIVPKPTNHLQNPRYKLEKILKMLGIFSVHECSVNVGHKFAGMVAM